MTVRSGDVPGTILSRRPRRLVGITLALPAFLLAGLLALPGAATAGDPTPPPPVFESASGFVPPGESISTLNGPLDAADPFAVDLKNVGNQTLFVTITEEPCGGTQEASTQEDSLCGVPRVGGVAGDFVFEPSEGSLSASSSAPPVVVARLFYDESLLDGVKGFKIFWQETPEGPVLRLPRCDDGLKTECFKGQKKSNGDQIVRIPLSQDPKFTRG